MDLNLGQDRRKEKNGLQNTMVNKLIEELTKALKGKKNIHENKKEEKEELEEYNRYEKKKIFLDNKTRNGNDLAWIMDNYSVCLSENGDGGPISVKELDLPQNKKVGEVYEKIEGKYVYNSEITEELNQII